MPNIAVNSPDQVKRKKKVNKTKRNKAKIKKNNKKIKIDAFFFYLTEQQFFFLCT